MSYFAMLAPVTARSYGCSSGNTYNPDPNGVISGVRTGQDMLELLSQGCILLTPQVPLLARLMQANFGVTTDQQISMIFAPGSYSYRVTKITVTNTNVNGMSSAAGGIYTGTSKSGSQIVASSQVYTGLTNPTTALDLTLNLPTLVLAAATPLYFSLTSTHGGGLADIYVYGDVYPT